jgi:hypothetical protein
MQRVKTNFSHITLQWSVSYRHEIEYFCRGNKPDSYTNPETAVPNSSARGLNWREIKWNFRCVSQWSVTSGNHCSDSSSHKRSKRKQKSRQIVCDRTQTHLTSSPTRQDRPTAIRFRVRSYSITVMYGWWLCLWQFHSYGANPGGYLAADSSTL